LLPYCERWVNLFTGINIERTQFTASYIKDAVLPLLAWAGLVYS